MRSNLEPSKYLIEKKQQLTAATEKLLSVTNDWQMIKQYLTNRLEEIKLSEVQKKKLDRYQFAYNQLISGKYTDPEVISMLMNFYKIKISQAYEDMNCTRELFMAVLNINKRFELMAELQSAKALKQKCIEHNDFKSAREVQRNIIDIINSLPDEDVNPGELFEGHNIEAVFDPQLLGAPPVDMKEVLKAINAKRKVNIKTDMFEDIDHDPVQ